MTTVCTPVAVYIKKIKDEDSCWSIGKWEYTPDRYVWGLMYNNTPTHMNYGFDYAEPTNAVKQARKRHPDFPWWSFDAGRQLYVKLDDLEAALKKLALWKEY